jgi:GNAT superfamily N-acetyltransferase
MPQDLLVKLYDLPSPAPRGGVAHRLDFDVRRALPIDKHVVVSYVRDNFLEAWASECEMAFSHQPPRCFIAVHKEQLLGFACYDATCWGFFGPLGVGEAVRRRGIGTALVQASLSAMWNEGYAYAVIGWVEDDGVAFYQRAARATIIAHSHPGIYNRMIHR